VKWRRLLGSVGYFPAQCAETSCAWDRARLHVEHPTIKEEFGTIVRKLALK
jgi:hypothetical protein